MMNINTLLEQPEYNFLKHYDRYIILLGLAGSHSYGTNIEGSDVDLRGIYKNNIDELYGIKKDREQTVSEETDTTLFSLKKATNLLLHCNPASIEMMGLRYQDYIIKTPEGQALIDNVQMFLSKKVINTFGGYAKSQLNRLVNKAGKANDLILENEKRSLDKMFMSFATRHPGYIDLSGKPEIINKELYISMQIDKMPLSELANVFNEINSIDKDYRKSVRNDKAAAHGKLSKHMMHLIRLYNMGTEILKTGEVNTYRSGEEHNLLMDIRNGKYLKDNIPTKEFEEILDECISKWEEAQKDTWLPDKPDYEAINKLIININTGRIG